MEELLEKALSNQLPFVIYRKPNETTRFGWFQKDNRLNKIVFLDKSCFVFAPFSGNEKVVFYPENCQLIKEESDFKVSFSESEMSLENPKVNQAFHINLVKNGVDAIKSGKMEKVVLSRREEIEINSEEYELYFKRFLKKYPTAFVYWFYHPKVGMWMGATPEQLVKIESNKVKTVSLAGTMIDTGIDLNNVVWGIKEQDEQKVVTDFILNNLKSFSKETHQTEPFTHKAGSLLHIKTDIEAILNSEKDLNSVIESLHPTPALCGFPKEIARKFIIENEGYDREFYGGFLGEWKFNNLDYAEKSDLFVNLRCMKIDDSKAYLFLGGGVNKDSDPESEYKETVNKSKTVKSIL